MSINPIRSGDAAVAVYPTAAAVDASASGQKSSGSKTDKRTADTPTREELTPIVENLNAFMTEMTADIHFTIHEKTKMMIVQVVDTKTNEVLKEFPPREFLDMVARISEYVGVLLDKRV